MKKQILWSSVGAVGLGCALTACQETKQMRNGQLPNVIVVLADDLGYGDVSGYGATKIRTPQMDRLIQSGIRFTQGYATSATSTPSRYALMTGLYPWKNPNAKVLPGDAPLIIPTNIETLPKVMQQAGYATAAIGKWHLGLGQGNVNWNETVSPNPRDIGYEYSYIQAATNDRVPCVYVENGNVDGLDSADPIYVSYKENFAGEPTGKANPERLKMHPSHGHDMSIVNGVSRIGFMKGGKSALWRDETMAEVFMSKANAFIEQHKEKPFFMYLGFHQPHVPRVPNERFVGKSGMGPRGDAILEADWMMGQLLDKLEELGLRENTLIVFSSDNGPVIDDGYNDQAVELLGEHTPSGQLRGGKYSMFEGGTRVPFVVSWPAQVKVGVSDAMVCHIDLMASMASLVGVELSEKGDGEDMLSVLLGDAKSGRDELIIEGMRNLALRQGDWVMIPPSEGKAIAPYTNVETARSMEYQLYNLKDDPGETINLATKEPEVLERMKARFVAQTKESTIGK